MNFKNRKLKKCDKDNTPFFNFENRNKKAKVVNIVDGDTVDVVFKHNKKYSKFRCRLYGINTPETRTTDQEEKEKGLAAKEYTKSILLNNIVKLECKKFDSFGRILGTIFIKKRNFNQELINLGHAVEYH